MRIGTRGRAAALLGVAWVGTLIVAIVVSSGAPGNSASAAKLLAWVSHHTTTAKAIGWVTLVSVVVALSFFGVLRQFLARERVASGLATLSFGGAVIFGVGLMTELGLYWGAAERIKHLTVSAVEPLRVVVELGQITQDAGIAVLTAAAGLAIFRSRLLPSWLGWGAVAVAIVSVIPVIDPVGALAFVVWTLVTSIVMYARWEPALAAGPQPAHS